MGLSAKLRTNAFDEALFLAEISALAVRLTGVQLAKKQESMVRSRLQKRAMELGLNGLEDYAAYFDEHEAEESKILVSLLTTHHTFFFREFQHFEYLEKKFLPEAMERVRRRPDKTLRIWSAACSRGQEVYSLAMFLSSYRERFARDLKFEVLGSDVDPDSVSVAKNGVFTHRELMEAPLLYIKDHWVRGQGEISEYVKAKPSLRDACQFQVLNLVEPTARYPQQKFDVIFCRNLFIYFNPEQIRHIVQRFESNLAEDGLLVLGVSESISNLKTNFESFGPSIYKTKQPTASGASAKAKSAPGTTAAVAKTTAPLAVAQPIRVLSVDDSSTIHTLLKSILAKDSDFVYVGQALSGKDAIDKVGALKPDVITLDIHMPEMDGIEYLRRQFKPGHPPVVMLSSVSRDDSDLAYQALSLGAVDYIEKPALANLEERGDEIRAKLKAAFEFAKQKLETKLSLDQSFAKSADITHPEKGVLFAVGPLVHAEAWKQLVLDLGAKRPPIYFFLEGGPSGLPGIVKKLAPSLGSIVLFEGKAISSGEIAVADLKTTFQQVKQLHADRKCVCLLYSGVSKAAIELLSKASSRELILEETKAFEAHRANATEFVPKTSFAYLCKKAFSG